MLFVRGRFQWQRRRSLFNAYKWRHVSHRNKTHSYCCQWKYPQNIHFGFFFYFKNYRTTLVNSGVFRIWQRGAWRARGARAYNGGLGAEPPAGSRGRAPGRGFAPLKLKHFLLLNVQWKPQIRPFFWNLETRETIKHCWILQFFLENGKKRTFSYKVACKKFSWSGQRGAIAPWPFP